MENLCSGSSFHHFAISRSGKNERDFLDRLFILARLDLVHVELHSVRTVTIRKFLLHLEGNHRLLEMRSKRVVAVVWIAEKKWRHLWYKRQNKFSVFFRCVDVDQWITSKFSRGDSVSPSKFLTNTFRFRHLPSRRNVWDASLRSVCTIWRWTKGILPFILHSIDSIDDERLRLQHFSPANLCRMNV